MSPSTSTTPAIRVYDSGSRHGRPSWPRRTPSYSSTSAVPMPIPRARDASPPPPLPPPRYISGLSSAPELASWHIGSPRNEAGAVSTFGTHRSDLSLLGGMRVLQDGPADEPNGFDVRSNRRDSSSATIHTVDTDLNGEVDMSDEDRPTSRRPSGANRRLHSESQLGQISLDQHSNAYDKQQLAKIGGPKSGSLGLRPSGNAFLSPTSSEPSSHARSPRDRLPGQLKPLSMPDKQHSSADSPGARWRSAPSSGISPGNSSFRSPLETSSEDPWRQHNSASTPDRSIYEEATRSKRSSDDQGVFMDHDFTMDNENGMRDLNLSERSSAGAEEYQLSSGASLKRRAPSPPSESTREDRSSVGNDLYHRRSAQMLNNRHSPVSRYQSVHGSVSSASSLGQKASSLASTMSWNHSIASSMTSYGDRLSPSAMSPSVDTDYGLVSPYAASRSLNPSPRSSVSKTPHHATFPESDSSQSRNMSSDNAAHSRQNSVSSSKVQGHFICECCPKKPKKFDSAQELRAHEQEKQYQCQYCPNRFKNKNEAERHQNSLHLRRHSWSCAALAGVQAAFHPSGQPPSATDTCGYCGEEFANPPNWDVRSDHVNHYHKFGECNQAKKFFRADHFRQHLKHSHAGASGKWTNMLENACMKDEPPPSVPPLSGQKDRMGSIGSLSSNLASPVGAVSGNAASTIPGVINEVHDES